MSGPMRVRLKSDVSERTLKAAKSYLATFVPRRHAFEYFDNRVSIHFSERSDLRLLVDQFSVLVDKAGEAG